MADAGEDTTRHQFDSLMRKVMREEVMDYRRMVKRRLSREVLLDSIEMERLDPMQVLDEYPSMQDSFPVLDYDVSVRYDLLSEALTVLPEKKRLVLLLSFFLDMNDKEIAQRLHLARSTIRHHRISAMELLRKWMEVTPDEEKE